MSDNLFTQSKLSPSAQRKVIQLIKDLKAIGFDEIVSYRDCEHLIALRKENRIDVIFNKIYKTISIFPTHKFPAGYNFKLDFRKNISNVVIQLITEKTLEGKL